MLRPYKREHLLRNHCERHEPGLHQPSPRGYRVICSSQQFSLLDSVSARHSHVNDVPRFCTVINESLFLHCRLLPANSGESHPEMAGAGIARPLCLPSPSVPFRSDPRCSDTRGRHCCSGHSPLRTPGRSRGSRIPTRLGLPRSLQRSARMPLR
jgi:hypothetical protein